MKRIVLILVFLQACASVPQRSPENAATLERRIQMMMEQSIHFLREGSPESLKLAQQTLEVARELSPEDGRVLDGLGCVEWRNGNRKLAKYFFRRAIKANPEYDRPYGHLALIAEQEGDRKAAQELFRLALKLNPLNYRARNNFGVLLLKTGASAEGSRQLLRASASSDGEEAVIEHNVARVRN